MCVSFVTPATPRGDVSYNFEGTSEPSETSGETDTENAGGML